MNFVFFDLFLLTSALWSVAFVTMYYLAKVFWAWFHNEIHKYKEGATQNLLEVDSNDGGAHVGGQKNIA